MLQFKFQLEQGKFLFFKVYEKYLHEEPSASELVIKFRGSDTFSI
jgi:hypothetical protein